jgi:hypothetical protein
MLKIPTFSTTWLPVQQKSFGASCILEFRWHTSVKQNGYFSFYVMIFNDLVFE